MVRPLRDLTAKAGPVWAAKAVQLDACRASFSKEGKRSPQTGQGSEAFVVRPFPFGRGDSQTSHMSDVSLLA